MERYWIQADNEFRPFAVCDVCKALVPEQHIQQHKQWHEKLRRAEDEGEILG